MERKIKCLVWDLDDTLWIGTLLEGDELVLRPGVREVIRTLDERGILQSVASRNDPARVRERLEAWGLWEYFLHPRCGWGPKSEAVEAIRAALNLGREAMAFVDDQAFEREEVRFSWPEVLCLDAAELERIPDLPEFQPISVTPEAAGRRELYRLDMHRQEAEAAFSGPRDDFLATLGMVFTLWRASAEDLRRAEELTVRTHQLNTTGQTYDLAELEGFRASPRHRLLLGGLEDRFGPYGTVGLALVEGEPEAWRLRLLLMSCRVMGRGVGTVMLHRIMRAAFDRGLPLRADFRLNGRNDMMLATLRFAGFRELERQGDLRVLELRPVAVPPPPPFLAVRDLACLEVPDGRS